MDPGDREILHGIFRGRVAKKTVLDLTTVKGLEFTLQIEPGTFRRQLFYSEGLWLPGHLATVETDVFHYEGLFSFLKTKEEIVGHIPHCGFRRSGRLKLCHEQP